jgi:hypothetical protein
MAEQTVAVPEAQTPPRTERPRHHERYVAPPVDIYETREGLVVLADVPGVAQEALDVRVDHNPPRGPGGGQLSGIRLGARLQAVCTERQSRSTSPHGRSEERGVNRACAQGAGGHTSSGRGARRLNAWREPVGSSQGPAQRAVSIPPWVWHRTPPRKQCSAPLVPSLARTSTGTLIRAVT